MITVFLVRHADIDLPPASGSDDPSLNSAGQARARMLAHVVGSAGVEAIFTSSFARTKQTVKPLAAKLMLAPRVVASPTVFASDVTAGTAGSVILVAGHSNTVPAMISALNGPPVTINHDEFDNLFVMTMNGSDKAHLIHLKYGHPS